MPGRISKCIAAAALVAITLCAAAYWTVEAVVRPARVRNAVRAGLSPFFPGGFDFESATCVAAGRYRLSGFSAHAPGRAFAWLKSPVAEIRTSPDGSIASVALGPATFDLDPGPIFIPPGGFLLPQTVGRLPEFTARDTMIFYPAAPGARVLAISSLDLRFVPSGRSGSISGSFDSALGRFAVAGEFEPGARCSIRAVVSGAPVSRQAAQIAPVNLLGQPSGALTLIFGGGRPPTVSGGLSYPRAAMEGLDLSFETVRLIVKGQQLSDSGLAAEMEAASGRAWRFALENVHLKGSPGFATFTGRARVMGGSLIVRGALSVSPYAEGSVTGADLSAIPPNLFGAATPSAGKMDVEFTAKQGAIRGSFRAADAALWQVPLLSGIGRAVSRLGGAGGARFRRVEGEFAAEGGAITVHALKLEGAQTTLELETPGYVAANRSIGFDFTIRLKGAAPRNRGLPPFDALARALSHAITDPITKALCFRMRVTGTLDAPKHSMLPPAVFRRG